MKPQEIVDYTRSLDCIHCGLCLRTCPTYRDTGRESSSPRGRIHMMRSLAEGDAEVDGHLIDELDACLVCRNCESVCPSGVEYAQLIGHTRDALADSPKRGWLGKQALRFGLRTVLTSRRWIELFSILLRIGQVSGLLRFLGPLGRGAANLPKLPARRDRRSLPPLHPAQGKARGAVLVLEGCVMPAFFGRVNRATLEVLQACAYDVHVPTNHVCCGAMHAHNGDLETARKLARQTIEAMESPNGTDGEPWPVVVNSAGCGAQMKEYGTLLADDPEFAQRALRFSARVRDFNEFLAHDGSAELATVLFDPPASLRPPLAFDDPCHLCHGQGIRQEPRDLLAKLGLPLVEIQESESCCGSAGLFAALRPADSQRILAPRLQALEESGARTLVTSNPGCQLQWMAGAKSAGIDVQVLHIAEVLQRSLAPPN